MWLWNKGHLLRLKELRLKPVDDQWAITAMFGVGDSTQPCGQGSGEGLPDCTPLTIRGMQCVTCQIQGARASVPQPAAKCILGTVAASSAALEMPSSCPPFFITLRGPYQEGMRPTSQLHLERQSQRCWPEAFVPVNPGAVITTIF